MTLTRGEPVIEKIFSAANKEIRVISIVPILRDGERIGLFREQTDLRLGDDLSSQDERVLALARAVWPPETLEKYDLYEERVVEGVEINDRG